MDNSFNKIRGKNHRYAKLIHLIYFLMDVKIQKKLD